MCDHTYYIRRCIHFEETEAKRKRIREKFREKEKKRSERKESHQCSAAQSQQHKHQSPNGRMANCMQNFELRISFRSILMCDHHCQAGIANLQRAYFIPSVSD